MTETRFLRRTIAAAVAASVCAIAPLCAAQDPVAELLRGADGPGASEAEQDPAEVKATAALNDEIVAQNELAASAEQAAEREHQARLEAHRAEVAAIRAAEEADRAAYEAEVARQNAEYERRMAMWREVSDACRRGETERCRVGRLALETGG